jgi:hypothetical protein
MEFKIIGGKNDSSDKTNNRLFGREFASGAAAESGRFQPLYF